MSRRTLFWMVVSLGVVVASFSYLRVLARRVLLETWPHGEDAVRTRLNEVALRPASGSQSTVTLYFPSLDKMQLLAEKRTMALASTDSDRVRQILLALIEGSHLGYRRALPASTEIRAVFLAAEGSVYVDFSNDLLSNLVPGIASETLTIYSVVNTLAADVPSVRKVKIIIQGQEVETLNGHTDLSGFFYPDPALNPPERKGVPARSGAPGP